MKDLTKVQKTLSEVFDYLNNKNDNEVSKRLLTEVGDAHRIVENLVITDVVVNEAIKDENTITLELNKPVTSKLSDWEDKSEVEVCQCDNPDICQDNTGLIYDFNCKKPMTKQT